MKALLKRLWPSRTDSENEFDIFLRKEQAERNVLIFTEHVNATYFISFDIPMRHLHAQGKINLAVASQKRVQECGNGCWARWHDSFQPDVVIMTRYGRPYGSEIVDFFRRQNIPVIYHIDDDLLEIPESLGSEIKARQGAEEVVAERRQMLASCDLIYASTAHLASILEKRFPKQPIYHGIYAPYLGDDIAHVEFAASALPTFGYMGSKGHRHDLDLAVPAIERLMEERPDLRFEVFGSITMPERLRRFGSRVTSHTVQTSYRDFLGQLARLNWLVGLAPLVNEPFNRCKAPTKFIEYTAAGIPVIASNISVYADVLPQNGGALVGNDNWHETISTFLDSADLRKRSVATARQHCSATFNKRILEQQILHVLEQANR